MSLDVDRLAEEVVRGALLVIERQLAPLRADNAALLARVEELEARAPVPGPAGDPGRDGKDGAAGRDGIDGKDGAPGRDGIDGKDGAPGRDGINGKDGAPGERGDRGADGRLPIVRVWAEGVHYAGDFVTHDGATWQAVRDTGRAPPHDDWSCIAAAGKDGRSLVVRGTHDAGQVYGRLDVVAFNGGSFVALCDNPGDCPGPEWQLLTAPGKRGQRGEDGGAGPKGDQGPAGPAGPAPLAMFLGDDGALTLTLDTGEELRTEPLPFLRRLT